MSFSQAYTSLNFGNRYIVHLDILMNISYHHLLKLIHCRAVRHSTNETCGTRLMSTDASNPELKKFDCPENAKRNDIVTWQTLTCLSKDHSYSIRMEDIQGTSAFR